ncbi:MAG: hypothetical protein KDK72_00565 [Chlamydiia bacterium]|nr:hypothetical protein [Chlamydiia bacterium]
MIGDRVDTTGGKRRKSGYRGRLVSPENLAAILLPRTMKQQQVLKGCRGAS